MRIDRRRWVGLAAIAWVGACTSTASPEPRSPCAALCERIATCDPPEDFVGAAECTRICDEDPRQLAGPCRAPRIAYERCVSALGCGDAIEAQYGSGEPPGPCAAERSAVLACEPEPPVPTIDFQF